MENIRLIDIQKIQYDNWNSFIEVLFQLSDYFIMEDSNDFKKKIAGIEKFASQLKCSAEAHRDLSYLKTANGPLMYACNGDTLKFFKKFSSFAELNDRYSDLTFLKNGEIVFQSISHEDNYMLFLSSISRKEQIVFSKYFI